MAKQVDGAVTVETCVAELEDALQGNEVDIGRVRRGFNQLHRQHGDTHPDLNAAKRDFLGDPSPKNKETLVKSLKKCFPGGKPKKTEGSTQENTKRGGRKGENKAQGEGAEAPNTNGENSESGGGSAS